MNPIQVRYRAALRPVTTGTSTTCVASASAEKLASTIYIVSCLGSSPTIPDMVRGFYSTVRSSANVSESEVRRKGGESRRLATLLIRKGELVSNLPTFCEQHGWASVERPPPLLPAATATTAYEEPDRLYRAQLSIRPSEQLASGCEGHLSAPIEIRDSVRRR